MADSLHNTLKFLLQEPCGIVICTVSGLFFGKHLLANDCEKCNAYSATSHVCDNYLFCILGNASSPCHGSDSRLLAKNA